jgi:hypothetical protein
LIDVYIDDDVDEDIGRSNGFDSRQSLFHRRDS